MANELVPVTEEVLEMVREIVEEHEPQLAELSLAVLFWKNSPQKGSKLVLGQTKKVTKEYQALGFDHDFIIFLSMPQFYAMNEQQQRALIHHELLHCGYDDEDEKAYIVPHDFEEFDKIIKLYGFWWPMAERTVEAVQAALPMMEIQRTVGRIETLSDAQISVLRN